MDGVVGGAAEQKEEEAALVRCVERPRDQSVDLREERSHVRGRSWPGLVRTYTLMTPIFIIQIKYFLDYQSHCGEIN